MYIVRLDDTLEICRGKKAIISSFLQIINTNDVKRVIIFDRNYPEFNSIPFRSVIKCYEYENYPNHLPQQPHI